MFFCRWKTQTHSLFHRQQNIFLSVIIPVSQQNQLDLSNKTFGSILGIQLKHLYNPKQGPKQEHLLLFALQAEPLEQPQYKLIVTNHILIGVITVGILQTTLRVLAFWHHRMRSFGEYTFVIVSPFIDLSCAHLYTVFPFHLMIQRISLSFVHFKHVSIQPQIASGWGLSHPLNRVLGCSRVIGFIASLLIFRPYTHTTVPPTLVQTRACGPLKRHTYIWLSDFIHSRAWTA